MRKFTWIAVVLVLLVLQMAFFFFASRKDGQVDVRVNPDYQETTYAIIKDGHEFKMGKGSHFNRMEFILALIIPR